jgi:dipeptidyl aminopeptidase/acylaminoacyl peptidase
LRDILSVREITEQHISPDGRTVAFVIKDADLAANGYDSSLYTIPTAGNAPPKLLLRAKAFSNVRWTSRGEAITYLSGAGKLSRIWRILPQGGEPATLLTHPESITQFEWSPDGNSIAFVSVEPVQEAETAAAAEKGVVYNDSLMFPFWDFVSRTWVKKPTRMWLYRVQEKTFRKLWDQEPSTYSFENFSISKLAWAPDGQKIAVVFNTSAATSKDAAVAFNSAIGLISPKGGERSASQYARVAGRTELVARQSVHRLPLGGGNPGKTARRFSGCAPGPPGGGRQAAVGGDARRRCPVRDEDLVEQGRAAAGCSDGEPRAKRPV